MEIVLTLLVASRGWHVYGKTVWQTPKKGQKLFAKREEDEKALLVDEYSVAWMMKSKARLVADVVGHVPQEISRFVYFFLKHGGSVDATVELEKYRQSPIAKGGLEIILKATCRIEESKRPILLRLKELINKNYELNLDQLQMLPTTDLDQAVLDTEGGLDNFDMDKDIVLIEDED